MKLARFAPLQRFIKRRKHNKEYKVQEVKSRKKERKEKNAAKK
jgi:hypothetical protein